MFHLCHGKDETMTALYFIASDMGVIFGILYSDILDLKSLYYTVKF
jgi:hypothetical protein